MHYYELFCILICMSIPLYKCIYAYLGMFLLVFDSCPILLLPLARRVTKKSKEATQNYQMQAKHWPGITALSVNNLSLAFKTTEEIGEIV